MEGTPVDRRPDRAEITESPSPLPPAVRFLGLMRRSTPKELRSVGVEFWIIYKEFVVRVYSSVKQATLPFILATELRVVVLNAPILYTPIYTYLCVSMDT